MTGSPNGWNAGPSADSLGVLQIESFWKFNAKYEPTWLPRYIVYDSAEQFVPMAVQLMRAESLTEIPVFGRFLTTSQTKRSGPMVPGELLESPKESADEHGADHAKSNGNDHQLPAGERSDRSVNSWVHERLVGGDENRSPPPQWDPQFPLVVLRHSYQEIYSPYYNIAYDVDRRREDLVSMARHRLYPPEPWSPGA